MNNKTKNKHFIYCFSQMWPVSSHEVAGVSEGASTTCEVGKGPFTGRFQRRSLF